MRINKRLGTAAAMAAALGLALLGGCSATEKKAEEPKKETTQSKELNIYSSRHYDVDKTVYADFEKETGIKVNVVEGKIGELRKRLTAEKDAPKADLLLTVGAESIEPLVSGGMLDKFDSEVISKNIPAEYRGEGWTGMTSRARIIAYSKDRVDPAKIKSYDDITKPEWKGKVLVRSATSSYNQALLSSFIELNGTDAAKKWAKGVTDNMARAPKGNDRDQAKAVAAGEGDLAIMNSYYYVRMSRSSDPAEKDAASKIGLIFPENTHVNLSFAGLIKGAKNKDAAVKFMEYVSGEKIQALYADKNGEFPLNQAVKLPEIQASWGKFTPQKLDFAKFGAKRPEAVKMFDEVGWK